MPHLPQGPSTSFHYQIAVEGRLEDHWSDWFEDMTLSSGSDGSTLLSGPIRDQAALFGLLIRIRDLGLSLVSVTRRR